MHHPNPRVAAFSMLEMLVVLVLSSILVGVIYFAYYTISAYQHTLVRRQAAQDDAARVFYLLKKDFDRSETMYVLGDHGFQANLPQGRWVRYTFTADVCLRAQATVMDTLACPFSQVGFQWRGQAAVTNGPLDELTIVAPNPDHDIHLYKAYDAAALLLLTKDSLP